MRLTRFHAAIVMAILCLTAITCRDFGQVSIQTTSLPNGVVGRAYSAQLQGQHVSGGWFVVAGLLPVGLTLNSTTGVISGTPTVADTYTFTIEADQNNSLTSPAVDVQLSITITPS